MDLASQVAEIRDMAARLKDGLDSLPADAPLTETDMQELLSESGQLYEKLAALKYALSLDIPSEVQTEEKEEMPAATDYGIMEPTAPPVEETSEETPEEVQEAIEPEPEEVVEVEEPAMEASAPAPDLFSTVQQDVTDEEASSVAESFHEEDSVEARIRQSPISDLKKAIGINERFQFINELFDGNMQEYNELLDSINNFSNHDQANDMINGIREKYNWQEKASASVFLDLVERRFLTG